MNNLISSFALLADKAADTSSAASGAQQGGAIQLISMLVVWGFVIAALYFIMIRPQRKKSKEEKKMRENLQVGDEIVTIGGLMGKVVHVTDDTVTFETGEDQVRSQVTKWAISTNVRAEAQAQKEAQEKKANGGLFGKKKKEQDDDKKSGPEV